jgi:hypothetical protein
LVQAVLVLHLLLLALMVIHQFMGWLWLAVAVVVVTPPSLAVVVLLAQQLHQE